MPEEKKQLRVEDLEVGNKVLITLGASRKFIAFEEGTIPGPRAAREELPAGQYVFNYTKNAAGGSGDNWLVTEHPVGSKKMFGISARFLFNLASQSDSNITIENLPSEPPPVPEAKQEE